jgi:hypothetical protein
MPTDINEVALRAFGRHFVTLTCMQTPPGAPEHVVLISGFIIEVSGHWFYVTAGHILRDIDQAHAAGSTFDVWRLGDQSAGGPHRQTGIPFDFVRKDWIVIRDDSVGLDYAALHLRDLYRLALESGRVVPLVKDTWGDHVTEYDQWVLVGVPAETVAHNGQSLITAKLVGIAVVEADEPEGAGSKAENQFYAKLRNGSESHLKNVEGMSGGPLFATKRQGGDLRYKVIGVQSAWYPLQRIIAVCPFSSLGLGLEEAVRQIEADVKHGAT